MTLMGRTGDIGGNGQVTLGGRQVTLRGTDILH